MPDPITPSILCPILIGRDNQLATLARLLEQTRGGQGQVALLSGEAGIGKSRLIGAIKQMAAAQGFTLRQGNCYEQDLTLPYAPVMDLLSTIQNETKLPAELALLTSQLPHAMQDSAQAKRRLFEVLANFLRPAPQASPQLLVLEDLHWCDEATLEFLHFFGRKLAAHPLLLIGTFRPDEVTPPLGRWLAAVERTRLATELKLTSLIPAELAEMVRTIFHLPRTVQPEFVTMLHTLTAGNPFFVEEVLKSCVADGSIFQLGNQWGRKPLGQLQIPRTVQIAVQQRMAQLTPPARTLLTLAAVLGQRWSFDLLLQVSEQDEQTLIALLREAIAAQLVVEEEPDQFAFRHALTRQAVYSALLARERRLHHRTIAEQLEQMAPARTRHATPSTVQSATLAYHFEAAAIWDKTLRYAQQAGAEAQNFLAPHAVVEQFSRALTAAAQLALPPPPALLRGRGQAHEMLGNFAAALTDLEAVLGAAQASADQTLVWQALLDLGFLWTSRDFSRAGTYFAEALTVARTLNDPATVAHTLNRIGNWHVNLGRPQEGQAYHEEALALFTALDDDAGVAATLDLLAGAVHFGGDLRRGMALYAQAADRFRALGDQRGLASAQAWLVFRGATALNLMVATASLDECIATGEAARRLAQAIGWRPGEAFAQVALAFAHGARGTYGDALTLAQTGLAITEELQHAWTTVAGIALGTIYLDIGAFAAAQQTLTTAVTLAQQWHLDLGTHNASAFLALAQLRHGGAAAAAATLAASFGQPPLPTVAEPLSLRQRLYWFVYAELLLQRGAPDTAYTICERLLAAAQGEASTPEDVVAKLYLLRGLAESALGQLDAAFATLLLARQTASQQGAQPLVWRSEAALGDLAERRGEQPAARAHYAAACHGIEALAATFSDLTQRRHFLDYALSPLPTAAPLTPARAAKAPLAGLTDREREVATLIAQGKTDRQIAEQLVLSKRTVSTHVTNILNKLNFASRTQIAAWAVEKGLATGH